MRQLATQESLATREAIPIPVSAGERLPVDVGQLLLLALGHALAPPMFKRRPMTRPMQFVFLNAASPLPDQKPKLEVVKPPVGIGYRKLFLDPGQWRVLYWGDFKEILASQLAHPERLRDTYRLPCYVQVIETERTVAIEELAKIYKSESKQQTPLYMLTDELAAKLDLALPLRPVPSSDVQRAPNTLLPHERVFRLVPANDPTIDVTPAKSKSTPPAVEKAPPTLKTTIPTSFIKEWEFKLSREEATYDMNAKPAIGTLLRRACRRLRFIDTRKEFRKWQTLLAGKSSDEQLWTVRPPKGSLADSFVRIWVKRTLELAGYDSQKMILEWEIFWRRRGC
jgi:hypothetical protein